jgi:PAS domain S-box-containing protein
MEMANMEEHNQENFLLRIEQLEAKLFETEQTLNAIRNGEVDAIVVSGEEGERIFSLTSAETPYRILIEEMQDGAVIVNDKGIIQYCNRRFAELVSVSIEQILGTAFERFIHENEKEKFNLLLRNGMITRVKGDIVYLCKGEEPLYLHLSLAPLSASLAGGVCIIVTDITELKKYQQELHLLVKNRTTELEQANQKLRETNNTKDKLFSVIAHDLRGPFTSLLGFSSLLKENVRQYDSGHIETILTHINSAARNAFTLLENLLTWARSQNKQLEFNLQKIDIHKMICEISDTMKSMAEIKDISLEATLKEGFIIIADENMIKTILRNFISNAIKFTNQGGKIIVSARRTTEEVVITVADNGVGMTEEIKNNLFSLNTGSPSIGTANEKGTGLGLIISKEFAEKHGGHLEVESRPGNGSIFSLTLPIESHKKKEYTVKTGE